MAENYFARLVAEARKLGRFTCVDLAALNWANDEIGRLRVAVDDLRTRAEAAEKWQRAVEDAAVVSWVPIEGKTPREAVNALLAWESQVALDPAVSEGAAKLRDEACAKGQRDKQKEIAEIFDTINESWTLELAASVRALPIKEHP